MIYDLPALTEDQKDDMILSPWDTKSDTFFFVNNQLVIHNRAEYNYAPLEDEVYSEWGNRGEENISNMWEKSSKTKGGSLKYTHIVVWILW